MGGANKKKRGTEKVLVGTRLMMVTDVTSLNLKREHLLNLLNCLSVNHVGKKILKRNRNYVKNANICQPMYRSITTLDMSPLVFF